MSRGQAGEPAKTGPERAGPRTPVETEPRTETTADLTNVLKRGAGMAAIAWVICWASRQSSQNAYCSQLSTSALRLISPTWYGSVRDLVVRVLATLADRARLLV